MLALACCFCLSGCFCCFCCCCCWLLRGLLLLLFLLLLLLLLLLGQLRIRVRFAMITDADELDRRLAVVLWCQAAWRCVSRRAPSAL